MEAEIAKGILESNGIHAKVFADNLGSMNPHLAISSGVKLLVSEEDAEKSIEILEKSVF